jgi:hypothetical protein
MVQVFMVYSELAALAYPVNLVKFVLKFLTDAG